MARQGRECVRIRNRQRHELAAERFGLQLEEHPSDNLDSERLVAVDPGDHAEPRAVLRPADAMERELEPMAV